tara:strand:+ start:1015 stop:1353 length:339 start_codon:yes stop_codon:yes gene_type:complete
MADVIRLVKGDEKPLITVTLTDDSNSSAMDLSASSTSITVKFRAKGSTTTLATITTTKVGDGTAGQFTFDFAGGVLTNASAGAYEGEIVVNFNSNIHTVYDLLQFRVRDSFA